MEDFAIDYIDHWDFPNMKLIFTCMVLKLEDDCNNIVNRIHKKRELSIDEISKVRLFKI